MPNLSFLLGNYIKNYLRAWRKHLRQGNDEASAKRRRARGQHRTCDLVVAEALTIERVVTCGQLGKKLGPWLLVWICSHMLRCFRETGTPIHSICTRRVKFWLRLYNSQDCVILIFKEKMLRVEGRLHLVVKYTDILAAGNWCSRKKNCPNSFLRDDVGWGQGRCCY
jgi:hypothetical protein